MESTPIAPQRLTFSGLASGIDTAAIIEGLLGVERIPLQRVQAQRSAVEQQQGLIRQLNTLLLGLRTAAQAVDNRSDTLASTSPSEELLATAATSSSEALLQVVSDGNAAPGTFSVRVDQLASAARRVSAGFASADEIVGQVGETLDIDTGAGTPISIELGAATLTELRDLINSDPANDGRVRASLLDDGVGVVRLVILGTQVGAANDVDVTTSAQAPGGAAFVDGALSAAASDARLVAFGVPIWRPSNEVTDVIPGVTLRLQGVNNPADPADAVTVTVSRDDDEIQSRLQRFVDAFNAVRNFAIAQSAVSGVTNRGGALSGDSGLRLAERTVQDAVSRSLSLPGNPFSSLSAIGIRFAAGGTLALDREVMAAALDRDPDSVRQLLSGDATTDGIATGLARALESLTRMGDGVLPQRIESITTRLESFDDRIAQLEARLERREIDLVRRFASLEQLISSLRSSSAFLDELARSRN